MKKALTIAQIEKRFDSEWILLGDPVLDEEMRIRAGTVLFHAKDRDEVYRQAIKLRPKRFAMLRIGKLPKEAAIAVLAKPLSTVTNSSPWPLGPRVELMQENPP